MIADAANLVNTNVQTLPDREVTPDVVKESHVNNTGLSEAGRTKGVGQAVVNNISAATLETSRAATAPEQAAEQNRSNDIIKAQQKGQLLAKIMPTGQAPRQSQVDKTI